MDKKRVSVISPVYNEIESIEPFLTALLSKIGPNDEIIVVDDNSPDGTWKKVEEMSKKDKRIRLLNRLNKRGPASAIRDGAAIAKGNIFLWLDIDMDPKIIPTMIGEIGSYDVVIGSRYVKGGKDKRNFFRFITSFFINFAATLLLNPTIRDYSTGYVAVKREVYEKITFTSEGYGEYCIEFLYKCTKAGLRIKEIPYIYGSRTSGKTKAFPKITSYLKHIYNYSKMLLKLSFSS